MPSRWEMPPVYLQSGDPETESTATLHASGLLGARFTIVNPQRQAPGVESAVAGRSKRYQLVKTASDASVAPYNGATAYWADRAGYVVTTNPATNNRNDIAGIFCRAWERAGDYMCVQVTGPKIVKLLDATTGAVAEGASVIPSATAGKADVIAIGTAPTYVPYGRIASPLTFNAAAREVLVDLDVPETT
jgi:hypothetical protein